MPNVIPLPAAPASAAPAKVADTDLGRHGRRLGWLLTGLLCLIVLFAGLVLSCGLLADGAGLWIAPGNAYFGAAPSGTSGLIPFGVLPRATRWAYGATFVLDTIPVLLILTEARAWARDFGAGIAFGAGGPARMRRIALWLTAYALAPALGHGLVLLAGHGVDLDWLHASSLHALVLAACLVTLAEVARIGHAIASDLDGFV